MTGQDDSKFGFGLASGDAAAGRRPGAPVARVRAGRRPRPHRQPDLPAPLLREGGRGAGRLRARPSALPELCLGGGLGVAYVDGEDAPVHRRVGRGRSRRRAGRRASTPAVTAEPGRAIAAAAGLTLYRVGTIKDDPRRPHLRLGRRRHERQPPAGALRQRLRGVPAPGHRRRAAAARSPWSASTASRATSWCATPSVPADLRRRRRPLHAGHRRLRPLDGVATTTRCPGRRSCSCATARPGWSCGARPSTTCSASTE